MSPTTSKIDFEIGSSHLWRATSCARQEKIEDFHFHDVRHAFATILLQGGLDLYKVQQLLGYK